MSLELVQSIKQEFERELTAAKVSVKEETDRRECGVSRVKEEHESSSACVRAAEEAGGQTEGGASEECARAKEEPEWTQDRDSSEACPRAEEGDGECGVSAAAARAGLYAGHEVKGELVLGPERLQPPNAFRTSHNTRDIKSVKTEPVTHITRTDRPKNLAENSQLTPDRANFKSSPKILHQSKESIRFYICDFCGKQFTGRYKIAIHFRTHTGEKPHPCEICKKQFADLSTLIRHRKIHTKHKPYACEICGKAFSEKYLLENHKRTHSGERPYSCSLCQQQFTDVSLFLKHKRNHWLRPFACAVCGKRFTLKPHLTAHEVLHDKVKPHACDICGKRYVNSCHLSRHVRTHAAQKPYSCHMCAVQFSQRSTLERHWMRRVCGKRRPLSVAYS